MKILVFGGTRFIGKKVVDVFLSAGHEVTLVSRRAAEPHHLLFCVRAEREDSYNRICNIEFDCIIDFMAYDVGAVEAVARLMPSTPYIFVSTAWIDVYKNGLRQFLPFEEAYVRRKIEAEEFLKNVSFVGRNITICRLPITLGAGDHTERFKFYTSRILVNRGLILPDGGKIKTRFAFLDDVAMALAALATKEPLFQETIFDVLPDEEICLAEFVDLLSEGLGVDVRIFDLKRDVVDRCFSGYLDFEPLWREATYTANHPNLFEYVGGACSKYSEWILELCKLPEMRNEIGKSTFLQLDALRREKELFMRL